MLYLNTHFPLLFDVRLYHWTNQSLIHHISHIIMNISFKCSEFFYIKNTPKIYGLCMEKKKMNIRRRKLDVFVQNFKDIPIGKIYTKFYSEY